MGLSPNLWCFYIVFKGCGPIILLDHFLGCFSEYLFVCFLHKNVLLILFCIKQKKFNQAPNVALIDHRVETHLVIVVLHHFITLTLHNSYINTPLPRHTYAFHFINTKDIYFLIIYQSIYFLHFSPLTVFNDC